MLAFMAMPKTEKFSVIYGFKFSAEIEMLISASK